MTTSILKIGKTTYALGQVALTASHSEEGGEHFLTVDLFADTRELTKAGFAINCLTFRGICDAAGLQDEAILLRPDSDDELNELGESVICRPGEALEIDRLSLNFGRLAEGRMPVTMEAVCHASGGAGIPVSDEFEATVHE